MQGCCGTNCLIGVRYYASFECGACRRQALQIAGLVLYAFEEGGPVLTFGRTSAFVGSVSFLVNWLIAIYEI